MQALFLVVEPHEAILPNPDGVDVFGWWIAPDTEAPNPLTAAVVVEATDEKLNELAELPGYFYLGDVDDGK